MLPEDVVSDNHYDYIGRQLTDIIRILLLW